MRKPINLGHNSKTPLILGQPNDEPARFVEGTGLYLAIRKGDQRWVTGSAVQAGLQSGVLIDVHTDDAPALSKKQLAAAAAAEPAEKPVAASVPADTELAGLSAPKQASRPTAKAAAPKPAAAKKAAPAAKKAAPKKRVAPKKR